MKREELVTTLTLVGGALATHNLVPIFQCFCFDGKKVSAYNDSLGIIAPCKTDDAFAVNGQTLLGLLTNSHGEEVTFTLEEQDVIIKTGRSTFKLPYLASEDFLFEKPEDEWAVNLPLTPELLKGIRACLLTTSKDTSKEKLMGVCLHQGPKRMTLYSCDGDALTRCVTEAKAVKGPSYMIPNGFCETVTKNFADLDEGSLELNEGWAKASVNKGFVIYGRLMADEPLDHDALIKRTLKDDKPAFVPVPKELKDALSRARVVADAESAKTLLTVDADRLKLLTETHMGVVRDSLALGKHDQVRAHVSAELMQRAISLCDEFVIRDNCCVFREGDVLLQILSNMD